MARLVFHHRDFTLELHAPKLAETLAAARRNGLGDEALSCDWAWGEGVERVVWQEEAGEETPALRQPLFFDNAAQDVWVQFEPGCTAVRAELRRAEDAAALQVRKGAGGGPALYGPLVFGNDVGRADFTLRYRRGGEARAWTLSFDVLSSKLDAKRDWRKIVEDVEAEYRMLSYDFLRRTYRTFRENPDGDNSDAIWWAVFETLRVRFFKAADLVLAKPRTKPRATVEWRRADRIVRATPALEEDVAAHRGEPARRYRTEVPNDTRDTPENRFFLHAVRSIAARHRRLSARILERMGGGSPGGRSLPGADAAVGGPPGGRALPEAAAQIRAADKKLAALKAHPFFRGVGRFEGFRQLSLTMQHAPGYAELMRTWGVLERFYALGEGLARLETKDIAELYEIWCFIEVKNRCKAVLGVDEGGVRNVRRGELCELFGTDLAKGKKSRIVLEKDDPASGTVRLELFYNPETADEADGSGIADTETPTGGRQRPDIVLQLVREHAGQSGFRLTYLFDAKYRIGGKTPDGTADAPPEDALNQMHRYRDAIYYSGAAGRPAVGPYRVDAERRDTGTARPEGSPHPQSAALKREVIGGYILFPGSGRREDVERAYYTRSIDAVNIGALPLRPGNAENATALEDFIRRLLSRGTAAQLLGTIPNKGTELTLEGSFSNDAFLRDVPKKGIQKAAVKSGVYPAPLSATAHPDHIRWILLSLSNQPVRVLRVLPDGYLGSAWTGSQIRLAHPEFAAPETALDDDEPYHRWRVVPVDSD